MFVILANIFALAIVLLIIGVIVMFLWFKMFDEGDS